MTRSYTCSFCHRTGQLATFTSRPLKPVRRGGHTEVGSAYQCKDKLACAAVKRKRKSNALTTLLGAFLLYDKSSNQ
jgi:hypothetical protein